MRRREVIAGLGAAAAWPLAARAQQPKAVARIGLLATGFSPLFLDAFRQGLSELGYVEGANILVEYRGADSKIERFPALASELVRLRVDLIVATNSLAGGT
jgi:putative ABC transport system substrate-binding protein